MHRLGELPEGAQVGGKAAGLVRLLALGCRVPPAVVITGPELAEGGLASGTRTELAEWLSTHQRYAVRSSGALEDLPDHSFAGQYRTHLDVDPRDVPARVEECFASLRSASAQAYARDRGLELDPAGMSVIVQEMVPAEASGVVFTINPTTGADTEIVIEVVQGSGDRLVDGQVVPERYVWDWYSDDRSTSSEAASPVLSQDAVRQIGAEALRIQRALGHPCDLEFAFAHGELFLLQARPITKVAYSGLRDTWTTAVFRDGISAEVCKPYMWSLYEFIWEDSLLRFILDTHLLPARRLRKLGDRFFGRGYWNLSLVKEAMARVPGYRERLFDEEFGIQPTYEGEGRVTPLNAFSLARVAPTALAQWRFGRQRERTAEDLRTELLWRTEELGERWAQPDRIPQQIRNDYRTLLLEDFRRSEDTYFWQIFLNTIHHATSRKTLLTHLDEADYFDLIAGLDNVSHLRPFHAVWDISRQIRRDPEALQYWTARTTAQITADLTAGSPDHAVAPVRGIVERFGYHSTRELDVSAPDFGEDPTPVVQMVRDTVALSEEFSPAADRDRLREAREAASERLRSKVGRRTFRQLSRLLDRTRAKLWWREEFRDVSTRYYHLIRIATRQLAELLVADDALDDVQDIWMLPMPTIVAHLDGTEPDLRPIVQRNRAYYESFRNYLSENEIGPGPGNRPAPTGGGRVVGVPASGGVVVGTARVVTGPEEMDRIQPGDILVTRFTDTGWTPTFAQLSGIVTEQGGILCHGAVVAREYGIPCIVGADGATQRIRDGATVHLDGAAGVVTMAENLLQVAAGPPQVATEAS